MGIAPYKTFTFDGESSADYGVYITGTGVFNAPERAVELIEIPNRNGAYALDKGRFENIEVTYNVGIVDDSESDFADRVSAFRNWLCSKVGYCRLEDEYNPDEYRMALFSSGIQIDHDLLIAGEAEITFNCKPQRWLKSGETAVTVADGGTIDNPTLFEASPLLMVEGYGNIAFGKYDIDIQNVVLGDIVVANGGRVVKGGSNVPITIQIDNTFANNGDVIKFPSVKFDDHWQSGYMSSAAITVDNGGSGTTTIEPEYRVDLYFTIVTTPLTYNYGTAKTDTFTATITIVKSGETLVSTVVVSIAYDGATTFTLSVTETRPQGITYNWYIWEWDSIVLSSTTSTLGHPSYIDCDIGECYMIQDGSIVQLNSAIDLGSDLPTLASGTNTFDYDNTVTDLKVVPRWWRV